ncbi:MAG: IS110 family transposase [Candidatus Marsarchaeota archaeon]|nr:IS110 family transposase [Candidatus Marsarchaeota archaeon]
MKQFYVGLDMGRKWIYGTILDENKKVVREGKIDCTISAVEKFLNAMPKESLNVVLEACGIWENLYDHLSERCQDVKVANVLKTKAIGYARKKTDKVDSKTLAELLLADMIPEAYVPDMEIRKMRKSVRHRRGIVKVRTMFKNQIHAILRARNIHPSLHVKDVFTKTGIVWLKTLNIDEIDSCIRMIDASNNEVKAAEESSSNNPLRKEIELLKTMPGVGDVSATLIMSDIADIKRFETPKKLCAYAGIVTSVYQSGDTERYGGITKHGPSHLRHVLVECADVAIRYDDRLRRFFQRIQKKKGWNVAITAVAHKMLYIMWYMLTKNQQYIGDNSK